MGEEVNDLVEFENDDGIREVNPESVDGGEMPNTEIHNTNNNFKTGSNLDLARKERQGRILYRRAVETDQRMRLLKNLKSKGIGTNRIEYNQLKSRKELRRDSGRNVEMIKSEMLSKTKDAEREATKAKYEKYEWNGMQGWGRML